MEAIILLADYGSRLDREDLPHKSLLPFGEETLLSRHLKCLQNIGIQKVHLILGHNGDAVKSYAQELNLQVSLNFIDNPVYLTTGNTLSMVMGLRHCEGETLILDGDALYLPQALTDYVKNAPRSSFALIPADIEDAECAKVLLNPLGTIHAFITKRGLTKDERSVFGFGGETIGFFMLSKEDVSHFIKKYEKKDFLRVLWEIPFTEFAVNIELHPWQVTEKACFEIDTREDYFAALRQFNSSPDPYKL